MFINFSRILVAMFSGAITFFAGMFVYTLFFFFGPGDPGAIKTYEKSPLGFAPWLITAAPFAIYAIFFSFQFFVNVFSSRKNFTLKTVKKLFYFQSLLGL